MKLQSMTYFVLSHKENVEFHMNDTIIETGKLMQKFFKYAEFLKQPLTIGMFVPCDEEGNVLTEPFYDPTNEQYWAAEHYTYSLAKTKVLFEGFELKENRITDGMNDVYYMSSDGKYRKHCLMGEDIEYMVHWDLEFTPSALKAIGL